MPIDTGELQGRIYCTATRYTTARAERSVGRRGTLNFVWFGTKTATNKGFHDEDQHEREAFDINACSFQPCGGDF